MARSFCGYPVIEALLINKYLTLAGNQVKCKGTFVTTNPLKMQK